MYVTRFLIIHISLLAIITKRNYKLMVFIKSGESCFIFYRNRLPPSKTSYYENVDPKHLRISRNEYFPVYVVLRF